MPNKSIERDWGKRRALRLRPFPQPLMLGVQHLKTDIGDTLMIRLKILFTTIFVILIFNSSAFSSEQYQFASDVFKAFKILYDANSKFDDLSVDAREEVIKEIDVYNETFYKAAKIMDPYKNSKVENIKKTATELSFSLLDITKHNTELKKKYDSDVITEIQGKNKYAYMFFNRLTEMVISTMINSGNDFENKKLLITDEERNKLIEQLEKSFFEPTNSETAKNSNIKDTTPLTPYEIAASVMYYFLKPEARYEKP